MNAITSCRKELFLFYLKRLSFLQDLCTCINYSLFMSMPLTVLQTSFISISHLFPFREQEAVCLITSARHSTLSIILVDFYIKQAAESKTAHRTCGIFIKQPNSFIFSLYCFLICCFDKGINILMESVTVIQCHAPS